MDSAQRDAWTSRLEPHMFQGAIRFDEPMAEHTTLGIGGPADVWVEPLDPVSCRNAIVAAGELDAPITIIGGGSNLLVRDGGIRGLVLSMNGFREIQRIREGDGFVEYFVESGAGLGRLVSTAVNEGYAGLEGLAGIPGTFGGAVRMNAGSYGHTISEVLVSVAVMDPAGMLSRVEARDIEFGYRQTSIPAGHVILSANLRLTTDDPAAVRRRTAENMERKRGDQPLEKRSAGSVFCNPPGGSAWRLIDEAGMRDAREGGVRVSEQHANFFVNEGGGTGGDFLRLVERVRRRVKEQCGTDLRMEIAVVGEDP